METLTVFGELPWSLEFIQSCSRQRRHQLGLDLLEERIYERNLGFYPNHKVQGKKLPAFLCRKMRLLAQSWRNLLQTINNRSIANCVQRPRLVYVRAVGFTSAHFTQVSRSSLNALVLFLSSRIKRGPSLKRRDRAMTISRALKHQRLNRSPSCLTLTLCPSSLPPQRSAFGQHLSRPHTPH